MRRSAEGEKSGESRRSSAASSPILSSRSASPASLISSSSDDEPPPVGSSAAAAAAVKSESDDDEIVVVREIPFNERAEAAPSWGSRGQQLPAMPGDVSQVAKSPIREDPSSKAAVITSSATEKVCGLRTCSPEHKKQRIIDGEEVNINLVDLVSSESEVDSENEANLITLD